MRTHKIRIFCGVVLFLAGCSAVPPVPVQSLQMNKAAESSASVHPESPSKTIAQVERKIRRSKGNLVTVSKKLLRQLIEEEKLSETRSNGLSAELEALKKVDREEAQKSVP